MDRMAWTIFQIGKEEQNFTMDQIGEQSVEIQTSTFPPQTFIANL